MDIHGTALADAWPATTLFTMTHMIYQGMFFIITPALICGAFAERMKFSTMVVFMVLWGTLHLLPAGPLAVGQWRAAEADGRSQPVAAGRGDRFRRRHRGAYQFRRFGADLRLDVGQALGYGKEEMRPHNLTYTAIGAAMLWVGWFGFNAGSALSAGSLATCAFAATHFAAAAGGITWAALEWYFRGKPSVWASARAWWPDWPRLPRPPAS